MSKLTCYLAGPVVGCLEVDAKDWRRYVAGCLQPYGVRCISPIRSVSPDGARFVMTEGCEKHGTTNAVFAKNRFDVARCDITLAYLPLKDFQPRVGTISEIAWTWMLGKQVVLVSEDPAFTEHPLIQMQCGWIVPSLDTGIEIVGEILGAYDKNGVNL
jgi:nucleoside 2-deoxyribosyltransferase